MGDEAQRKADSSINQDQGLDVDSSSPGTGGDMEAGRRTGSHVLTTGSDPGPEGSRSPVDVQCSGGRGDEERP
ncbi:MAG: hypothetical protein BTN85_0255 [Candidatus Methanohalarchaeum thermophilum]|uniref:Uncharacterized protein n=1 Tax=Methanohalarchaeum thermophilum TaxID=1903181 RepID=A0A1Q6DTW1_METT1|nr:MAG: hypothetical protein BTN85_0255 [Candidatus Methanohalarchaeum thermophilum]